MDRTRYRQARVRKLGRYVRIFPRNVDPDTPMTCMQVEIYGEPYISKCLLVNRLVPSCAGKNKQKNKQTKRTQATLRTCKFIPLNLELVLSLLRNSLKLVYSFSVYDRTVTIQGHSKENEGDGGVGVGLIHCHLVFAGSL